MILCRVILVSFIFFLTFTNVTGQDKIYYYGANNRLVNSDKDADVQKRVYQKNDQITRIQTWIKEGEIWSMVRSEKIKSHPDGKQVIWTKTTTFYPKKSTRKITITDEGKYDFEEYIHKQMVRKGSTSQLLPLHLEDSVSDYYSNGQLKSISFYQDNQLVYNQNWMADGTKYIDSIFYSVDETPSYSLDQIFFNNYIMENLKAAKVDLTQYDEKFRLGWVIMETGKIAGVHLVSGKKSGLSDLLVSLIVMLPGDWTPARLGDQEVRYFMDIPINFQGHRSQGFDMLDFSGGMLIYDRY